MEERKLINEFLTLITHFEEADNQRTNLSQRFNDYSDKASMNNLYLETPFLWLTVLISVNAVYHLTISRFYATEFYKFLLSQLRNLYPLIKRGVHLSALDYEQLQTKCNTYDFKLSPDEFELLKTTYLSIDESGLESFRSKKIKTEILRNLVISRKYKSNSEITRFYTLVGGKWWFQFRSSAFGLSRVFFHLHLEKEIALEQIIDFNDSQNTVLGLSDIHQVENTNSEFIGTLFIPTRDLDSLHTLFMKSEKKKYLKKLGYSHIRQKRRSAAFNSYKPNVGWRKLLKNERQAITSNLEITTNEKGINKDFIYISTPLNPLQWSFTQHPHPLDIIRLYCDIPSQFSYSQLIFDNVLDLNKKKISLKMIALLKDLYERKVLEVGFIPWRLIYNYSLNRYCIILPRIPLKKLLHFLTILPYAETYFSDHQIYIWTRIPVGIVSWIKNDLKWTILPVERIHPIKNLDFNWFDQKKLDWKKPNVLKI
jgi:hypothetical protein